MLLYGITNNATKTGDQTQYLGATSINPYLGATSINPLEWRDIE